MDLFEAFHAGEEGAPEHWEMYVSLNSLCICGNEGLTVSSVLAIRDGVKTKLDLFVHNVFDSCIFNASQLLLLRLPMIHVRTCCKKVTWTEEGA